MQTHTHAIWSGCVFPHAAHWEEKKKDVQCNRRMRKKESGCDDDDDGGGLHTTYQKRYSSLVSDSDSVRGTVIVCGTKVRWGREGWGTGREEKRREEREGKQVTGPVRCGSSTERGNVMGKFNIEDVDWRLFWAFLHIQGLFYKTLWRVYRAYFTSLDIMCQSNKNPSGTIYTSKQGSTPLSLSFTSSIPSSRCLHIPLSNREDPHLRMTFTLTYIVNTSWIV